MPNPKLFVPGSIRAAARGVAAVLSLLALASASSAGIDPLSGIDFVRIGAPGNQPWMGQNPPNPMDPAIGRGGVNYQYSIGRFEVTTAQWVEFYNAAYDRPANDRIPFVQVPVQWGAVGTAPTTPGGARWAVAPGQAMHPVGGISWRTAAIYCNWLCNRKSTDRSAFMNGAYDVSTFETTQGGNFTDQITHNAGARYWIPTYDELLKANHYDPDKDGPGQGGWWEFSDGTDAPGVGGPPGLTVDGRPTTGNFGWDRFTFPGHNPFDILLGAYPDVTTPWGMFDAAGATSEWVEEQFPSDSPHFRLYLGSAWATTGTLADHISRGGGGEGPAFSASNVGFRIAANVPTPGACPLGLGLLLWGILRRRRGHDDQRMGLETGRGIGNRAV